MTGRAERRRLLPATRDSVWAVLADFGAISRWGGGVDHSELLSAVNGGIGTERRIQVGRNALREQVVRWEPGRGLSYRVTGLPPRFAVTSTWELSDAPEGTSVVLRTEVTGPPFVTQLVARRMGRAGDRLLDGLAQHLQTPAVA